MSANARILSTLSAVDVRRLANDSIRDLTERLVETRDVPAEFLCECGDLRCDGRVSLMLHEYDTSLPGSVRVH